MNSTNPTITSSGTQVWYLDGKFHRIDGPAIIYPNGIEVWYVNHKQYTSPKEYQLAANLSNEDMIILLLKYEFN